MSPSLFDSTPFHNAQTVAKIVQLEVLPLEGFDPAVLQGKVFEDLKLQHYHIRRNLEISFEDFSIFSLGGSDEVLIFTRSLH
jgi:hypothetical protein